MQRCLEVIEQLLEEEDAEPFAEPVNIFITFLHKLHYHSKLRSTSPAMLFG